MIGRITTDSLRFRFLASASLWITLGVACAGVMVSELFRLHVTEQFHEELHVHLHELAGLAHVDATGAPTLDRCLSDPRFLTYHSGFYWQIQRAGQPFLRSPSLGRARLPDSRAQPGKMTWSVTHGPTGDILEYSLESTPATGGHPLRISIAADLRHLDVVLDHFNRTLIIAMAIFTVLMLTAGLVQVGIGLRPLRRLAQDIADLRTGRALRLGQRYAFPSEIRPLINDLNALLDANAAMVQRARVQAGNLAHGLRTPLAVISDEADRLAQTSEATSAAALHQQCLKMQRQIDYHLARARAAAAAATPGLAADIATVTGPILRAMERMHGARMLQ